MLLAVTLLLNQLAFSQVIIIDETEHCALNTDSLNPQAPNMLSQVVCTPVHLYRQNVSNIIMYPVNLPPYKHDDPRKFEFTAVEDDDFNMFMGLRMQGKKQKHFLVFVGVTFWLGKDEE